MTYDIEKWFKFINWRLTEEELQRTLTFFSAERAPVREQFDKLSWDATEEEQLQAIEYLAKNLLPHEYIFLVLADKFSLTPYNDQKKYYHGGGGKARWGNAAKTVIKIGWPKVDNIVVPLFMWLLDTNWPGSLLIYDFLLSLPKDVLMNKMKEILDNPQYYDKGEYEDLKAQIEDLCEDAKIVL